MRVTEPIKLLDAHLQSSTIPEPAPGEPAEWVSGQVYTVKQRVMRQSLHRIYECVKDVGDRAAEAPEAATAKDLWKDMGPTQRWDMFTLDRSTASRSDDPITVVLKPPGRLDTLGLFGIQGQRVSITAVDASGVTAFERTERLTRRHSTRWSDYFFGGFTGAQVESLVQFNLPPITGATVTITLDGGGGPYALSAVVFGKSYYIGAAQYGTQSDALNFSKMDRHPDGTAHLIPRRNVPRVDVKVESEADLAPLLYSLRRRLLSGVVAIWSGLEDEVPHPYFEPVLVLGFARRWSFNLDHPTLMFQTLELEDF